MNKFSIKVESISKRYQLGNIGTGNLSWDMERWFAKMRGKEDPFKKIDESNINHKQHLSSYHWSLHDVSFELEKGDIAGIIGKNGAGKSTLLKILSKVTSPTSGKIYGKGKVSSLLEIGTGFHPELTGRENVFLNGTILGMKKKDIMNRFEEILDFSGIEKFIDTPVKRYSSGMYVRLAFAVAAHLDSDILIVDEVLSIGDLAFQKKCIGKMHDLNKEDGKTILFVSHNLNSIKSLCNKGIVLNEGKLEYYGQVNDAIRYYTGQIFNDKSMRNYILSKSHEQSYIKVNSLLINDQQSGTILMSNGDNVLRVQLQGDLYFIKNVAFECILYDKDLMPLLFYSPSHYEGKAKQFPTGSFSIEEAIQLPPNINRGMYTASIFLTDPNIQYHVKFEYAITIEIDGFSMKTGQIFDYDGKGFLFQPMQLSKND